MIYTTDVHPLSKLFSLLLILLLLFVVSVRKTYTTSFRMKVDGRRRGKNNGENEKRDFHDENHTEFFIYPEDSGKLRKISKKPF